MLEEIKSRLNLRNTCYSLVYNLWSSHVLCENIRLHYSKSRPLNLRGGESWVGKAGFSGVVPGLKSSIEM